jgi:hypothetical protein
VKILFVMKHPASVRSLDGVLRTLDEHGHSVHLAFGGIKPDAHRVLQRLADDCHNLTFGSLPSRRSTGWSRDANGWNLLTKRLRTGSDYLRYLEPAYADAPALRARAEARAHPLVRSASRVAALGGRRTVRALRGLIEYAQRCLPPPPHVSHFLVDVAPDALLVTNLARDSVQADFVRAAKRLGIHTAYPVFSWDNLTNKGLVHEVPELVLVWNEIQADEAVELHGIPRERVHVLGAWSYDHWFTWRPGTSREEFCAEVGLRADRPIVLYVCSSEFVAPNEAHFVRRWLAALRGNRALAEVGVLVRPHPRNAAQWSVATLDDPQATVWPRFGEEPLESTSRQHYFDSIYHSAAVVGINTSAQIESAIVGRPVHTILAPEFRETQQGTLHFQYLRAEDFGHLHVGRTMDEHVEQLAASIQGPAEDERNERFVRRFVRPLGLDVPAVPLYVEAVERLAAAPAPAARAEPRLAPVVRLALAPLAMVVRRRAARRPKPAAAARDELRDVVRRLRHEQLDSRVVAGPWLGSEIDELLYWIPFLRWAQLATFGLRDRLAVVTRPSSAAWYAGIGAERVDHDDRSSSEGEPTAALGGIWLSPHLVEDRRAQLAAGNPQATFLRRRLEFAPLPAPEPSAGVDLPAGFVAVAAGPDSALEKALADRCPTVHLDDDRLEQMAVLAQARGLVCRYGFEAYLAVLLGVPVVCLVEGQDEIPERERRLVSSFLDRPPYGALHVLEGNAPVDELVGRSLRLLESPVEALANA